MSNSIRIIRNRSSLTGRYLPGCRMYTADGCWIGPGLGDFRSAADARGWLDAQPAWFMASERGVLK